MGKLVKILATFVAMVCLFAFVGCDTDTPKEKSTVAVESVTVTPTTHSFTAVDETKKLVATVKPDDATDKAVTWKSSNTAIATVSADGTVTAVAVGTTDITATAGSKTGKCTVIVPDPSHEHTFANPKVYAFDDDFHWYPCSGSGCTAAEGKVDKVAHNYNDNDNDNDIDICTACQMHKPLKISRVLGGEGDLKLSDTIDTVEKSTNKGNHGIPSVIYTNNLEYYSFGDVTQDSNGNYKVTCTVDVAFLQKAVDGGAKDCKNIVAVLELDELKTFAIGNISRNDAALSDPSWVSDAPKFVESPATGKTYVTLWMSMVPDVNGQIADGTYQIKAYAGDSNPKTLTFKFVVNNPFEITGATADNAQIDGEGNNLVEAFADGTTATVKNNTVTVTFNKTKTDMRTLMSSNNYNPLDPLHLVLTTDIPETVTAGDTMAGNGKFIFTKGYKWDEKDHHEFNFKDGKIMLWLSANGDNEIGFKVGDSAEQTIKINYVYSDSATTENETAKISIFGGKDKLILSDTITDTEEDKTEKSNRNNPAAIYLNNLKYYNFEGFKTLANGNYEVTCKVNVAGLWEAADGGASGCKNILGVVSFDKIIGFTIDKVSRVGRDINKNDNGVVDTSAPNIVALGNQTWVDDGYKFVKDATEDDGKTYVTLWMAMKKTGDGNTATHSLPDSRIYEFKLELDKNDVRTLTVNFKAMD